MGAAGFVDLQVNGYGGISFSDPALTTAQVARVAAEMARRGTLAFCPTVVTAPLETYRRVVPVLAGAIRRQPEPGCRLLGLHLEGPFISPEEGAVGVHPRACVQAPSLSLLEELFRLADGQIALLTVAPERAGAPRLIERAVALGMRVSIGHTLADASAVRAAVQAGASLSTHLGNGCPNLLHRHHNPIWPQLAAPELSAMLITDGQHLPPEVIAAMLAAKGKERVLVTSDVAPAAGLPPGDYAFFGARVRLEASGRLRNLDADTLAGSASVMLDCMNHLASLGLLDEAGLWQVGRDNPLRALGLSAADLPAPSEAGRVVFRAGRFEIVWSQDGEPDQIRV